MRLRRNAARRGLLVLASFMASFTATAPFSRAQVVTATLTGAVADSSGATIPNAKVTATEASTGGAQQFHINRWRIQYPLFESGNISGRGGGAEFQEILAG